MRLNGEHVAAIASELGLLLLKKLVRDLSEHVLFGLVVHPLHRLLAPIFLVQMHCSFTGKFAEDQFAFLGNLCVRQMLLCLQNSERLVDSSVKIHALEDV